jgi:DNA replication licensing factor MCM7
VLDIFIHHRNVLAANTATAEGMAREGGRQLCQGGLGSPVMLFYFAANAGLPVDEREKYPPQLLRRYDVVFVPSTNAKMSSIRSIDAGYIGRSVLIEGMVIKATAVKPFIQVATYACDACGREVYQEVNSPEFMPLTLCTSNDCVTNRRKGRLHLQTRGSKFVKFQELRIQELPRHVPTGHIPRSLSIHVYGDNTRLALPGDHVTVAGVFLPTPPGRFRSAGLVSDTYLLAMVRFLPPFIRPFYVVFLEG